MPLSVTRDGEILVARFSGNLTRQDLQHAARVACAIEEAEDFTPDRLVDLTGVEDVQVGHMLIQELADERAKAPLKNLTKSAIIAPTPVKYGTARMYQTLNHHPLLNIEVFHNEVAAREWLAKAN